MKNYFIPYNLALDLKDKLNFKEQCIAYYKQGNKKLYAIDHDFKNYRDLSDNCIAAPLFEQAFDFIREKYFLSCSVTYNNKNKTYGTKRSKLEIYLEEQLTLLYPNLEILYGNKQIIGSELDIYIPSLKLAFEIQGIFHYEPIFGQEKLEQIQKNDLEKVTKCQELNIKLIVIDTRNQKRFTEKSSEPFLNLIKQFM